MVDREKVLDWEELCSRHEELHRNVPKLRCNQIEKKYYECIRDENVTRLKDGRANYFVLTSANYSEPLKELLFCDELQEAIDLRKHDLHDVQLKQYRDADTKRIIGFFVYLRGLSKGQPSLIPTDHVVLERHERYELCDIIRIEGDRVVFIKSNSEGRVRARGPGLHYSWPGGFANELDTFNVSFVQSGQHTYKRYHKALDEIAYSYYRKRLLFESPHGHELESSLIEVRILSSEELEELNDEQEKLNGKLEKLDGELEKLNDELEKLNDEPEDSDDELGYSNNKLKYLDYKLGELEQKREECLEKLDDINMPKMLQDRMSEKLNDRQRQAIEGIFQARCRPHPYILFGPPGTGKTTTLVEAVVQVCCRMPSRKVLVCANSNSCADQLTQLIIAQLSFSRKIDVQRLVSQSHTKGRSKRPYEATSPKELGDARVVVTTNNMAFNLNGHLLFDYVFIDEAGHAHEAESLIPILCLESSGVLVLAGDPKQLGPVIKCPEVERLGLGQSMLERLFNFKIYQRNPIDGNYDANYITKLLVSYRCDPRILEPSNKLFYEQELQCLGKCPNSLLRAMHFSHPLVFHKVFGQERRIPSSASCYNDEEAEVCVDYVLKLYELGLEPENIGVISMYQLQAREGIWKKLAEKMKESQALEDKLADLSVSKAKPNRWRGKMCQIDTVDSFQGQEREVMIISTVRTLNKAGSSSFLADSKRFNVAISRAKWLTIVVGHPAILDCHENWAEFGRCARPATAGDSL